MKRPGGTYNRVIRHISRLKLVFRRSGARLAVAQGVVGAGDTTKVEGEIASSADHAPVLILGDADLAGADILASDLEGAFGALESDDLLLANGRDERGQAGEGGYGEGLEAKGCHGCRVSRAVQTGKQQAIKVWIVTR